MARKSPRKRTGTRTPGQGSSPGRSTTGPGQDRDPRAPTDGEEELAAGRFADGRETDRELSDEDVENTTDKEVEEPARHPDPDPEGGRAITDARAPRADPDAPPEPRR